jgi:hypothetical protein
MSFAAGADSVVVSCVLSTAYRSGNVELSATDVDACAAACGAANGGRPGVIGWGGPANGAEVLPVSCGAAATFSDVGSLRGAETFGGSSVVVGGVVFIATGPAAGASTVNGGNVLLPPNQLRKLDPNRTAVPITTTVARPTKTGADRHQGAERRYSGISVACRR